jgi:hypothetical protein
MYGEMKTIPARFISIVNSSQSPLASSQLSAIFATQVARWKPGLKPGIFAESGSLEQKIERESQVHLNRAIRFCKDVSRDWPYRHKNIALLRNLIFALVPKSAQAGGIICHLGSGPGIEAHAIRELSNTNINTCPDIKAKVLSEIDSEIVRLFRGQMTQFPYSKASGRMGLALDNASIDHLNFVGSCLLVRDMDLVWEQKLRIFAFH